MKIKDPGKIYLKKELLPKPASENFRTQRLFSTFWLYSWVGLRLSVVHSSQWKRQENEQSATTDLKN